MLSAVVLRKEDEAEEVKLVDEVRAKFNSLRQANQGHIPAKKPLHFRDLKHEQRRFYASRIGQAKLKIASVCIFKPDLTSPEGFQHQHRLYYYAARLLLERVSWFCRDARRKSDAGDGTVDLILSNRSSMDYSELREYLTRLEKLPEYRAETTVIRPKQMETFSAGKRMGLQIADAVAGSTYFALERNRYDQVEPAYLQEIASRLYRHQGDLFGYGVKIAPRETEEKRRRGELNVHLA